MGRGIIWNDMPPTSERLKPTYVHGRNLEKGGGTWSALVNAPVFPGAFVLASAVVNRQTTRMRGKSNSRVSTRMNRGGLVVRAAPPMAEGTAGVESAGGAEKATTAKPEALEPWRV